ncbi:nitroreductase family protein [Mechercharimyces sp. CAU 1602]|uniref:nitroreductase family protein n=1 Tax=Mechercharimyces sp. CAU 1602 TaxID=2973933 RepID=UPI002163D748|nr:nitroreductase family protein [Mechercharimyces sp. CAU 1602]MCS1351086.1 nitroreductase family protein [Mechercharimyces sp. CAU 1602]
MSQKRMDKQDYFDKINEIKVEDKPQHHVDPDFFSVAEGRSSVRHYDPTHSMTDSEIKELIEVAIQAPSSSNLQPWRFLVIQEPSLKEKLFPIANNQQQIKDASAVIAVFGDTEWYQRAEEIYDIPVQRGSMTEEIKSFYVNQIMQHYGELSLADATRMVMVDGGLVSMQLMLAAKAKGYDTVPMGGFDPAKFAEEFNVPQTYLPVMLIAIGKAAKAGFAKFRLPQEEVTFWNKF